MTISKEKLKLLALSLSGVLVFLVLWYVVSYLQLIPTFFLPTPQGVLESAISLFKDGGLANDIGISLFRIISGFLLSVIISLPMGIIFGISRESKAIMEPIVAFIRYVPPSAFIPLIIVWFGVGEFGKIFLIFLGVAPYLTLLIADIIHSVPCDIIEASATLGASKMDTIMKVMLPYSMPAIWDSFRIMFGAAWTFVIIAEIVGSSSGIGHLMIESQRFLRTDNIFAGILVIGLLGIFTDLFFRYTSKILFPWNTKTYA